MAGFEHPGSRRLDLSIPTAGRVTFTCGSALASARRILSRALVAFLAGVGVPAQVRQAPAGWAHVPSSKWGWYLSDVVVQRPPQPGEALVKLTGNALTSISTESHWPTCPGHVPGRYRRQDPWRNRAAAAQAGMGNNSQATTRHVSTALGHGVAYRCARLSCRAPCMRCVRASRAGAGPLAAPSR